MEGISDVVIKEGIYHQINTRIRQKKDTAANWTSSNPVILNGELIAVETATGAIRLKVGDGVKTFSQLPFLDELIYNTIDSRITGVVDSAPENLNTLNKMASALNNDPNFYTTIATQIDNVVTIRRWS